jgi:hypothetical protein
VTQTMLCSGLLLLAASLGASKQLSAAANGRPAYRHAYYLFLAEQRKGCEDCYVPLLITAEPLEQFAKVKGSQTGVLVITYERDSVWREDGIVPFATSDIEAAPPVIHLRGRRYRYQEISPAEVLKLLENPRGTIAISRPYLPPANLPGPSLKELISDFHEGK